MNGGAGFFFFSCAAIVTTLNGTGSGRAALTSSTSEEVSSPAGLAAGMSETMNPSRADALVAELADKVASQMEKDGLLVEQ